MAIGIATANRGDDRRPLAWVIPTGGYRFLGYVVAFLLHFSLASHVGAGAHAAALDRDPLARAPLRTIRGTPRRPSRRCGGCSACCATASTWRRSGRTSATCCRCCACATACRRSLWWVPRTPARG